MKSLRSIRVIFYFLFLSFTAPAEGFTSTSGFHEFLIAQTVRDVDAPAEITWNVVKEVTNYNEMSQGKIRAKAPQLENGQPIDLWITLSGLFRPFGHSKEVIYGLNDPEMRIAWIRKVNFLGKDYQNDPEGWVQNYSQRWQWVVSTGPHSSRYFGYLAVPGAVGQFTQIQLKDDIQEAFDALADGIQKEAEKNGFSQTPT